MTTTAAMDDDAWSALLKNHPIFTDPPRTPDYDGRKRAELFQLSANNLPRFTNVDRNDDMTPSGRRQAMVLRDADLVVAAGKELRITSLNDIKLGRPTRKSYKLMLAPSSSFEIHQMSLNASGKLLAIAGSFQVAVVVMPRPGGYSRLVPETLGCQTILVGPSHHTNEDASPIAKVDWHPWGEAGSTLMVMTTDGLMREYDISFDVDEPQQVLSFFPQRKARTFGADDESEREVTSFSLGKGKADWGPLTIYALTKSGDVYAICPYLPQNAVVPSSYIHSLECFISAKQEFLAQGADTPLHLSALYDYQRKYVNALIKQLPPGTVFPAESRPVSIHPPKSASSRISRQGPFLLQPSPRTLDGSEGGHATDMVYLEFGADPDDPDAEGRETDHLGVVMISYQDGKVDVCLDVEKVEARWDIKSMQRRNELPMLAVYESIDLGLILSLKQLDAKPNEPPLLDLLQGNHPVFLTDPIHDNVVYVAHAFGVHMLNISPVLENLAQALQLDDDEAESSLKATLEKAAQTIVLPILATFSIEQRCSNPVIAVAIPNDVYLTYSIFILTSAMRATIIPLKLQAEAPPAFVSSPPQESFVERAAPSTSQREPNRWLTPVEGPAGYVSLLGAEPYKVPPILNPSGLPTMPKLSLPVSTSASAEFALTPDTLRFIGTTNKQINGQIQDIYSAHRAAEARTTLQKEEIRRQAAKCREIQENLATLKGKRAEETDARVKKVEEGQKELMKRLDRILQGLMTKSSPQLSEHEKKWFEELKRMKNEILGYRKYDSDSLVQKTKALEAGFAKITPALKVLLEKEQRHRQKTQDQNTGLGISQAFNYGMRSSEDAERISALQVDIDNLAQKLNVTLARPLSS